MWWIPVLFLVVFFLLVRHAYQDGEHGWRAIAIALFAAFILTGGAVVLWYGFQSADRPLRMHFYDD